MKNPYQEYQNPLVKRYTSKDMSYIFSPENKFKTWRKLWIALAEAEKQLGLNISQEQIDEMKENVDNINFKEAEKKEKELRHDVMSHVHAFGMQCPKAKPIIHLGATSAYVGDNTDIIQLKEAIQLLKSKILLLMNKMQLFAKKHKKLATLGFTHYQPAQITTVGKRATLWLQDIYEDFIDLEYVLNNIKFRGAKGTTGTQASYLKLFDGNCQKVLDLDNLISQKMGFSNIYPVTGQTYTRKLDYRVLSILSGIAQSAHKITNDIRLLQNLKEIEEPFEKKQIGSSAMAYKRNPMRSERVASLSKFVISLTNSVAMTQATQWFERTLDDSANKRLSIPESFMATDAIIMILINIFSGIVVYPKQIENRLNLEIPFMATENIIMSAVKKGGDRQELHEEIRQLSMQAGQNVKILGKENNLLDLIANSSSFNLSRTELQELTDPNLYIGNCPLQVDNFIDSTILPILKNNSFNEDESIKLLV